ncbi:hypothetical protein TCSYLVIO_007839 [Trypanosoma cruzi]|nr:hypothetical protein TCSYLVIO_007839 [Trypanosoma cruzi]
MPRRKGRRVHRMAGACRCGRDSIPGTTRTSCPEWRLCAQARCDSCPLLDMPARALRIKSNPLCRWCRPFLTEVSGPRLPPPEALPDVSTANPCLPASGGLTSSCPTCGRVRSSVHSMRAHARRTNSETPIVTEGLKCGSCDSSTVFPTSASRAVHYQKCQAYQRAKKGQHTSASSNDSRSPSATPLLQPHQPLSPRQSTGGPTAHAVGMPPSSTTEHPTIWEHTLSYDSTVQDGKTVHIATDGPQAINEQWQQSITKQIFPFSQHRKTSPSHSQLPPMNSLRNTALSCNTSWCHPGPLSTH